MSKDDPITRFNMVPIEDLVRNPNFLVAVSDAGGHCEFFYSEKGEHRRFTSRLLLEYFKLIKQVK